MGDNPCVYFITANFVLYLSLGSCYYCSNRSLSYFIALLCQVKSLLARLILDLDYCAETDFCLSRIWAGFSVGNSEKSSSDMYATFIQFEHFHLSKLSASVKFVFTDCSVLTDSAFYFGLPLLLCWMDFFVPLTFRSFGQCP